MGHKAIALTLVEAHAGIGDVRVGHLHIGYAGADAFDALSHEARLQFVEQCCTDSTSSRVLADVYARLAGELIGGPLLKLAGVGVADECPVSLIDSHKVWEMAECG